ncbi:MAG: hypothetical protein ACJA0C_001100 [Candidatus Endobugula sp.]|jgi:hypothetical protein
MSASTVDIFYTTRGIKLRIHITIEKTAHTVINIKQCLFRFSSFLQIAQDLDENVSPEGETQIMSELILSC